METNRNSAKLAWIKPVSNEQEEERDLDALLLANPDLEYLLEQAPMQTTEQIFEAAGKWNGGQKKPAEGTYSVHAFNFEGTDKKLRNFSVKSFENGRVTISVAKEF